jgi:tRNA threonylcarbamoyl adenosine modification protein (Sua5/YciO/YrdC/YwlC family)
MARRYDCTNSADRTQGVAAAVAAAKRGHLVVLPTETVYGLATDAFSIEGVNHMREVQNRTREVPIPVLIGRPNTADGLVLTLGAEGRALVEAFWPGPLTLVARAHPSLRWDIGNSYGTVSVRMPIHPLALEVLRETGPLALTAANRAGLPAPRTIDAAREQLADDVAVYLDAGELEAGLASTVVDVTEDVPRMVRAGAFTFDRLREVAPNLLDATSA